MRHTLISLAAAFVLAACGGGGSGGGGDLISDDAKRAVLADLGSDVIVPSLQAFEADAAVLDDAVAAYAADTASTSARQTAQAAWRDAMAGFSRIEVLQVGPAARSDQPGGDNLRDLIYLYPGRNLCVIDNAAYDGVSVNVDTRANAMGLGALEYLLFVDTVNANCPPGEGVDRVQARADYAAAVADFIATQAASLHQRWAADGGDFLREWSDAGLSGTMTYATPQDALDALSTALFYVEKETKDSKIACPTGIGATGVNCENPDPEQVEHPFARTSTASLRANVQAFRDVFTGLNGGMGVNDLLRGIDREDIATRLITRLDETLTQLDTEIGPTFSAEIEAIDDPVACTNAWNNATGEPAACALYGDIKNAMDIFRTEVVSALSLATPERAAGDND